MKKLIGIALLTAVTAGAFAQSVPQPAFRLLDGYLEKRSAAAEYGAKNGSWILMGTGLTLGAASATVWFAGDDIARSAGLEPLSRENRFAATLGLGLGAAVLTGIGFALHTFPPNTDERAQYAAIYNETDPALQERLAAARLQGMAENAGSTRGVNGIVNLALAGASLTLRALANQDRGLPWSDRLFTAWSWEFGSVVTGATSLLVQSPEETLYQEYLWVMARSAKD